MALGIRWFPYANFVDSNFCATFSGLNQGKHKMYVFFRAPFILQSFLRASLRAAGTPDWPLAFLKIFSDLFLNNWKLPVNTQLTTSS